MSKWWKNLFRADAVVSLLDKAFPVIGPIGTGGVFLWTSRTIELVEKYKPFSWVVSAALGVAVFYILLAIRAKWKLWIAQYNFVDSRAKPTDAINPLDDTFQKKRIKISDFHPPLGIVVTDKNLIDCELIGPGVIVFKNAMSTGGINFDDCDSVKIPNGSNFKNVLVLENFNFTRCRLCRLTILIPESGAAVFENAPGFKWANEPQN